MTQVNKGCFKTCMNDLKTAFEYRFPFKSEHILIACNDVSYNELKTDGVIDFQDDWHRVMTKLFCVIKSIEYFRLSRVLNEMKKSLIKVEPFLENFCTSSHYIKLGKNNCIYKARRAGLKCYLKYTKNCNLKHIASMDKKYIHNVEN